MCNYRFIFSKYRAEIVKTIKMFSTSFILHKMILTSKLLHWYFWDNTNLQCEIVLLLTFILQSSAIRLGCLQDTLLLPAPPTGWWYQTTSQESPRSVETSTLSILPHTHILDQAEATVFSLSRSE